ncbi:MAG TPA: ATP-grasp domain-containing protein [Jatrophihabitans sp.]|nr:ATP-grasp domain-containing protein [Jatrophihabitans sp.]
MTDQPNRPGVLLVLGLCSQRGRSSEPYRGYMLREALTHSDVWMFDIPGQTWQQALVTGTTELDVFDASAAVAAALELSERVDILGVWGPDEATIVSAAAVAQALGLPGLDPAAALAARDKSVSRQRFTEAGIGQPLSIPVSDGDEARAAAARTGYPLIAKPRALGASLGVVQVPTEAELAGGYAAAKAARYPGTPEYERDVLIETYISGPEISIDGYCSAGEYTPLFIARKKLGFAPYFEEVGHTVEAADPLLADAGLREVLATAHTALGLQDGVTHTEVRLSPAGPVVIEVNGRPGGDLIPQLGKLATGYDSIAAGIRIALGRPVERSAAAGQAAAIEFAYPPRDCRVQAVEIEQPQPAERVWVRSLVDPGAELRLPPRGYVGRWSYVLVAGDSVEECEKEIAAHRDGAALRWEALDG